MAGVTGMVAGIVAMEEGEEKSVVVRENRRIGHNHLQETSSWRRNYSEVDTGRVGSTLIDMKTSQLRQLVQMYPRESIHLRRLS